ncbi:MAG TPA: hypothetical protein VFS12_07075 [Terriglobia bacterium]|nr:hypothetical protein [Terriglobia bacterium]
MRGEPQTTDGRGSSGYRPSPSLRPRHPLPRNGRKATPPPASAEIKLNVVQPHGLAAHVHADLVAGADFDITNRMAGPAVAGLR